MHNNYYFLVHLTRALKQKLAGASLAVCFSQNKNELILGFSRDQEDFFIKAHLNPAFCCLYFPGDFQRARKNSIDLFTSLIDQQVSDVRQFLNERCFSLVFDDGRQLLFKMHGNRSNILLYSADNNIEEVFNSRLKNDFELDISILDRPIDQTKQAFIANDGALNKVFPTFGKVIKNHLKQQSFFDKSIDEQWSLIEDVLVQLNKPSFYLIETADAIYLSLIKADGIIKEFQDSIEAINQFFTYYISTYAYKKTKVDILNQLEKQIKQSDNYISKTESRLNNIVENTNYQQLADVIMANLHAIDLGTKEVTLTNFYQNNEPVTIKLKPKLSAQKNAEVYYRKSKNQSKEIENLESSIIAKKELLEQLQVHHKDISNTDDLKSLRKYIKDHNLETTGSEQNKEVKPFNTFEFKNFQVYVGKNAKSNDKMLQQYTHKEDLWLHAKDVSGSHVIIKQLPGQGFPKDVIEYAAQLAAYYSKRKNDTLCPVIFTPRKYVRKRKGDPAGAVVVDKEDVLMVEPKVN